ncbi:MAG: phosphatidate cytidylyltransferase [Pusillimonas sp.]
MLRQRVVTAIILLTIVFGALLAPQAWPMLLLLSVMSALALWEWLRLTVPARWSGIAIGVALAFFTVACGFLFTDAGKVALFHVTVAAGLPLFGLVSLFWLTASLAAVVRGRADLPCASAAFSLVGVVALAATWLALILLLSHRGPWFLVSLLALIWVADIAAYFSGKAFGRHKLAPRVSPGKTWEGAVGGVVGATLWVMISAQWPGSFGSVLLAQWSWPVAVLLAAGLGAISIVGDLFESLLKRRAGRKDSSGLLPGHGGVYDRVDALLPVAPLAYLLTGI